MTKILVTLQQTKERENFFIRTGALFLLAVLLVNTFCMNTASAGGIVPFPCEGTPAYLNGVCNYYDYIKPQCGPGYNYQVFKSMNGNKQLYDPDEMTRADICFTTGDWAYVGFGYSDGKWRHGFFPKDVFKPYAGWDVVPEYSLDEGQYGMITRNTVPYNGPSWDAGDYPSCSLSYGDMVYACMAYQGWYLCRFYNDHGNCYGYVYLWVPGTSIRWQ